MGRFEALSSLDEIKATPPVAEKPAEKIEPTGKSTVNLQAPEPGKSVQKEVIALKNPSANLGDKPAKYTTHIEPSLERMIKIRAIEEEVNDYDIVRQALYEFFKKK